MQREERDLARAGTCKTEMGQHGSRRDGRSIVVGLRHKQPTYLGLKALC